MATENHPKWRFRLYVAGDTLQTQRTVSTLEQICRERLDGVFDLEIIDILKHPEQAVEDDVIATPALMRIAPLPERRIIGDLREREKVLLGLELLDAPW